MKDLKERTPSHSAQYMRARKKRILRTHNEPLFVPAMSVGHEDRSPFAIHRCDTAQLQPAFAELIYDGLPVPNRHEGEKRRFSSAEKLRSSRLLFLAEFLETRIVTQRIPFRIEP
jgi:hypothetical protein